MFMSKYAFYIHNRWCHVSVSDELLSELLPGPVTLIFKRKPSLNKCLNPDTNLVGVRIPNFNIIRQLCREIDKPLALTSANVSNSGSTLAVEVRYTDLVRQVTSFSWPLF